MASAASQQAAHQQCESIRAGLVAARPELAHRIEEGPSGALLIPLPAGRSIEIGRMRRRGNTRWVVVRSEAGRARITEAAGPVDATRTALQALDAQAHGSTSLRLLPRVDQDASSVRDAAAPLPPHDPPSGR